MIGTASGSTSVDGTWPLRPVDPIILSGGRVRLLERSSRQQAAVRLHWQPGALSPFWSERGWLYVLISAVLGASHDPTGRRLADLAELGVGAQVVETDFACGLELTGAADDLLRTVEVVVDRLTAGRVNPPADGAAGRRFAHERRRYLARPYGAVEEQRLRGYVASPQRVTHDYVPRAIEQEIERLPTPDSVVVVGRRELAAEWGTGADILGPGSDGAAGIAQPVLTRPDRLTVVPLRTNGQALTTCGAVEHGHDPAVLFDLELALEFLAGWPGSVLNALFRHDLAWSYGVGAAVRWSGVGDGHVLHWSMHLQHEPERTRAVLTHFDEAVCRLLESGCRDEDVRRAGRRILSRELLLEDSVAGVMARHGGNLSGTAWSLAGQRWRHFRSAGTAELTRGLEHVLRRGTFIVTGPVESGLDEGGTRAYV